VTELIVGFSALGVTNSFFNTSIVFVFVRAMSAPIVAAIATLKVKLLCEHYLTVF